MKNMKLWFNKVNASKSFLDLMDTDCREKKDYEPTLINVINPREEGEHTIFEMITGSYNTITFKILSVNVISIEE